MADPLLRRVLAPVMRWARARSRVGIAVVGTLPPRRAEAWASPSTLPLGIPNDAPDPRQADLLVIVGRVSHKLAPFLVRAHAAMARPASVLWVALEDPLQPLYPTVLDVTAIVPVDAVVRGLPPGPELVARALASLDEAAAGGGP